MRPDGMLSRKKHDLEVLRSHFIVSPVVASCLLCLLRLPWRRLLVAGPPAFGAGPVGPAALRRTPMDGLRHPVHPNSDTASARPRGSFRAHGRRRVRLHALATHARAGWERYVLVEDVGIGGACIAVDDPLEPGDSLTLSVTGPTLWDPLLLRGRVAWVETSASLREREELFPSSSPRPGARHAGLTLEHRSRDDVLAWCELIATL